MASLRPTASLALSVRADTTRALNEFKRFSAQLDNKFLVSGLKLDVVRSALGQINREFQRAIGEQGLQAGQSLRSAQNQAAVILDTFKSVGTEGALSITEQFSSAFSQIAITAGGTAKDIQQSLSATAFISTNLPEEIRKKLGEGIMAFQRDARRAGLGDNYAELIQQFLAGQVTARELIDTGRPLESRVGAELGRLGGTVDEIVSSEQRSRIVQQLQDSSGLRQTLQRLIARADWGFTVIEDLNAYLFNPERGVFGVLREITLAVGDKTTIFRETRFLIESIFGPQGFFLNFFRQIGKIFSIEDPLRVVVTGIRWLTRQFDRLNEFLQSPPVQAIVSLAQKTVKGIVDFFVELYSGVKSFIEGDQARQISQNFTSFFESVSDKLTQFLNSGSADTIGNYVKEAVDNVTGLFSSISDTVKVGDWDPSRIQLSIREIGEDIRAFIRNLGKGFRDLDTSDQEDLVVGIITTLFEEVGKTIGAVVSEGLSTIGAKGLGAVLGIAGIVNKGLTGFFSEIFGSGVGGVLGGVATVGIGAIIAKRITSAILGFADSVIKALPFGRRLQQATGNAFSQRYPGVARFLGIRRTRESDDAEGVDGADGGANARTSSFQTEVVSLLRNIRNCVCGIKPETPRNPMAGRLGGYSGNRRDRIGSSSSSSDVDTIDNILGGLRRDRKAARTIAINELNARGAIKRGRLNTRLKFDNKDIFSNDTLETYLDGLSGFEEKNQQYTRGEELASRYERRMRYRRNRFLPRRIARRVGKGALAVGAAGLIGAGAIGLFGGFGGFGANASEIDPMTGEPISSSGANQANAIGGVLSGGLEGAMLGATIGSIVPGLGTAAGAVIGGVIGGIVPLMDKGVRKEVGDFISGIGKTFQEGGKRLADSFSGIKDWVGKGFQEIPRIISSIDWKKILINAFVPGGEFTTNAIGNATSAITSQGGLIDRVKNFFGIREVGGPALRGVSYLVGERGPELITPGVNSTVISNRDLMALGTASGQRTLQPISASFNITFNVNGGVNAGNVEELRAPVLAIINQAWAEATTGVTNRGSVI